MYLSAIVLLLCPKMAFVLKCSPGESSILMRYGQIRSDDWVEVLPSQRRLQFLSSFFFVSYKNFHHHQAHLNGNFRSINYNYLIYNVI